MIPGYIILLGWANRADWIRNLLGQSEPDAATLAGVVLLTVFAVFTGLVASTLRWLFVDTIHHRTGVNHRGWNFNSIGSRVDAFQLILESHYRYYQFYGNSLVSTPIFFGFRWSETGFRWKESVAMLLILTLFWFASRDSLKKYYERSSALMEIG